MRILIVPSWYPTPRNPISGIFVREQASALSRTHDLRLLYLDVLPRGEKRKSRRWTSQEHGYREEAVEVPNRPLIWQFAYLLQMLLALRKTLREFRPDVIHCHVAVPAGWGVTMLRPLCKVPIVLTEHSSEFQSWQKRPGLRWMAQQAFRAADTVITVTEGQRQLLIQNFPRTRSLQVVPNMVDTTRFTPAPLPPIDLGYRLLFVGLLDTDQKGLHVLLDALSCIERDHSIPISLDIIGDGGLRPEYVERARRLGLTGRVSFLGPQPNEVVARMLTQSHALVMPSLHESQGLAAMEALASGRPVIATRCGGPEYMIDESNGLIVEPGQPEPFAEAIIEVLLHLDRYDPHQIAAAAAKCYSRAAVTAALEQVYISLLRPAANQPR